MNKFIFFTLILLQATTSVINAQIESSGHTASQATIYSNDDILFFYSSISTAELSAVEPTGATNVTYTWETYQSGAWINATTSNDPSFINITNGGGYRVSVYDNGTLDNQYVCWTFQPEITSIGIDTVSVTCTTQFEVETTTNPLNYFNPSNGDAYSVSYGLNYTWTSNPTYVAEGMFGTTPNINTPPEETTFTLNVSAFDGTHEMSDDYVFSEPLIGVKADFTYDVIDREHDNEDIDETEFKDLTGEFKGSSEVVVLINDSSKGFNKSYTIDFELSGDEGEEKPGEDDLIEIIFDRLGSYYMIVGVKNDISECKDEIRLGPITVQEIELAAPNVFTPDGDGINDEFRVVYKSIKDFKMVIVNRWGRKVFQTTDPGKGWDGKIGGKDAAEGVYFYVITAEGFNKNESRKLEDALHLFRGN